MNKDYALVNGKKLRYGFTTGSAATAAAKSAAEFLINGNYSENVEIILPTNEKLLIETKTLEIIDDYSICSIIKDAGDDPDITNGIEIFAKVRKIERNEIKIIGGIGVGKVTKKGLAIEIGDWAINPVPRQMIRENLSEYIKDKNFGLEVEISVPNGEEIAKRTLNEKLGVIGGISILGTTGIVKPMSEEAFKKSLDVELEVLLAEIGKKEVIFSFGNYGKKYAIEKLGINEKEILITSNFIGYMLESAANKGVQSIKIIGNIGKVIKVAGGIFHTHNRVADGRLEILASNALLCGESTENLIKIMNSNTTEEAINYIENRDVFRLLSSKVKEKCESYIKRCGKEIKVEVLIFSNEIGELGRSDGFYE